MHFRKYSVCLIAYPVEIKFLNSIGIAVFLGTILSTHCSSTLKCVDYLRSSFCVSPLNVIPEKLDSPVKASIVRGLIIIRPIMIYHLI